MGGDDNNDEVNDLLESQIQENNANIEAERQQLRARQIDILKSTGQPNWQPTNTPAMMKSRAKQNDIGSLLAKDGFTFDKSKF